MLENKIVNPVVNESVKNAFGIFCKYGKIKNPGVVSQYLFEKGYDFGLDYNVLEKFSEPENPHVMDLFRNNGDLSILSDATLNRLMFEIKIRLNLPKYEMMERFYNKEISFDDSQLFKNACGVLRRNILCELLLRAENGRAKVECYYSNLANKDANEYFEYLDSVIDDNARELK